MLKEYCCPMSILFKALKTCAFILLKRILLINDIDSDNKFQIFISSIACHALLNRQTT